MLTAENNLPLSNRLLSANKMKQEIIRLKEKLDHASKKLAVEHDRLSNFEKIPFARVS